MLRAVLASRVCATQLLWSSLLVSTVFRCVLVRYADRGLVRAGWHNLGLFRLLYWLLLAFILTHSIALTIGTNCQQTPAKD